MKKYIAKRAATMFGVLLITLLITIMLVGSNMDTILKQGVVFQVRSEITENPAIAQSFSSVQEFEAYIQDRTDERIKNLGLDEPWYSPQRIGLTMYKIILLDFGHATFLTSDLGSYYFWKTSKNNSIIYNSYNFNFNNRNICWSTVSK